MTATIELVSKDACRYCRYAKELLWSHGVEFKETNLSTLYGSKQDMLAHLTELGTGSRTVPQVFLDGEFLGGYTAFARKVRSGELALPCRDPRTRRPPWWPTQSS